MIERLTEHAHQGLTASVSRRHFGRLTTAAIGGLLLGSTLVARAEDKAKNDPANILSDPHACRGLNTCKGKGRGGDNNCGGQGACATAEAHGCNGHNACKGQGGCGSHPGENSCKGLGSCEVPLKEKTWKKARQTFEAQMKKQKKEFGSAPAAKKKA